MSKGNKPNMLANTKFLFGSGPAAAGITDVDGAVIDMAQDEGYDGICLVAQLGDVTATAVPNLRLMGSALANGSSPSVEHETAAGAAAGAADWDNKLMVLDTACPANRYVFSRLIRATANVVLNSVTYMLYNGRKMPVVQGADVVKAAFDWVLSN